MMLDALREEWEATAAESADILPGAGSTRYAVAQAWSQIDRTLGEWEASNAHALQVVKMVLEVCHERKVNVEAVVAYWDGIEALQAVVGGYDAAWDRTVKAKAKTMKKRQGNGRV